MFGFLSQIPQELESLPGQFKSWVAPNPSMMQPTMDPSQLVQREEGYLQSPYALVNPNSFLAQRAPGIAGHLDNAFLTLANMGPTGDTAGENISNVMRGMMGARQFNQERAMQAAMLPMQMRMMGLQQQDIMSQIASRSSEAALNQARIPYEQAMEQRAMAQSDWYTRRVQEPTAADVNLRVAMGIVQPKDPNNWSPTESVAIRDQLMELERKQATASGGLVGGIISGLDSSDPAVRAKAQSDMQNYQRIMGGVAGARTGAEQNAPHPFADTQNLINKEASHLYDDLDKPLPFTIENYTAWAMEEGENHKDDPKWEPTPALFKAAQDLKSAAQTQRDNAFAKWQTASDGARAGIGLKNWLGSQGPSKGSQPPPAPKSQGKFGDNPY